MQNVISIPLSAPHVAASAADPLPVNATAASLWVSEERFRTLVRATKSVVWTRTADGAFASPQPAWEEYTGQSWEDYHDFGWVNAHVPEDRSRLRQSWQNAVAYEERCSSAVKDGSQSPIQPYEQSTMLWSREHAGYRYVLVRAAPLVVDSHTGTVREWIGVNIDITELHEIQDRLDVALRAAKAGTIRWSVGDDQVSLDERAVSLLASNPTTPAPADATSLEQFLFQYVHPDDRERVREAWVGVLRTGKGYAVEFHAASSKDVFLATRGDVTLRSESGAPLRVDGICWDITEWKRLAEERLRALKDASELDRQHAQQAEVNRRLQEEAVDTICHEIRGPLTGLFGAVALMTESLRKTHPEVLPTVQQYLEVMRQCLQQQKVLLDDVLDLSKLEANRMVLNPEPFDLVAMVRSLRQVFQSQLHTKHLQFIVRMSAPPQGMVFDGAPFLIRADKSRLFQVLLNLVNNAIKFTHRGQIMISISLLNDLPAVPAAAAAAAAAASAAVGDHMMLMKQVQIEVTDTGIGMSEEEMAQLFQRYVQATLRTSTEYGGSGLGLVISKRLVEVMGGSMHIESERDKGTRVVFTIASEIVPPAESSSSSSSADHQTKKTKPDSSDVVIPATQPRLAILIVEDNLINQKVLGAYLDRAGQFYQIASNGLEAVQKCTSVEFDLVFMDLEMPIMGGLEATRKIRELEHTQQRLHRTIIVGLSGNARQEHIDAARTAGMNDYLTKPYHESEIRQKLSQYAAAAASDSA